MRSGSRSDTIDDGLIDFSQYGRMLRRRKWLILAVTLLAVLVSGVLASAQPKSYASTAEVQVNPLATTSNVTNLDAANVNMQTQTQVATSTAVATLAKAKLHASQPPGRLLTGLVVTPLPKSTALTFQFTASSPAGAQRAAQAFADAYLSVRHDLGTSTVSSVTKNVKSRLAAIDAKLVSVQKTLASSTQGTSTYASAVALQNTLNNEAGPLRARLDDLSTLVVDPGSVIVPASLPTKPTGFPVSVFLAAGVVLGVVVGILLAFVWDRRDDRLHDPGDVEALLGLPLIAVIPGRRAAAPTLVDAASPAEREAYGALVARIEIAGRAGCRAIVVASPTESRDAAVGAVNLAVALASSGRRVALVAADAADHTVDEMLSLSTSNPGTEVARRDERVTPVPGLQVLSADGVAASDGFLNIDRVTALLDRLKGSSDYVVVSAPPVLVAADALVLASTADGTVVVATRDVTRRSDLADAEDELRRVGARLLGVVVRAGRLRRALRRRVQKRSDRVRSTPDRARGELGELPVTADRLST